MRRPVLEAGGPWSVPCPHQRRNQDVWLRFPGGHREFVPVGERVTFDNGAALDMAIGYGYLLPHVHGTDGFFIAKALKRHG